MFPDLWGLKPIEGVNGTRLRLARDVVEPFAEPILAPGRAPFYVERGWRSYPAGGYYAGNALRWLDYGGFRGGLSIFERKWGTEDRPNVRTFRSEKDPLSLRLLFEHVVAIAPGQTWSSGEFWMTPHRGGWAKGIEVYREYVKQVSPPRSMPRHVRDGIGFQTIWMMQPLERDPARAAFRFRDFPRVAEDAVKHGIDQIVPWGWCPYFSIPVPLNELLGTRQEFFEGIRAAKKLGVDIAPFTSIQTLLNQYAGRYGVKPSTGNWTYDPELIPNFRPSYVRAFDGAWVESENREWQKDALATMTDWISAGMSSFSWDQFSSKSVNGQKPDIVAIFEKLRALARSKDPESTASAESITDLSLEHDGAVLDFTWNWLDYVDAGPILNVLRTPRLNANVEDSPLVVKKGFIDGLYLNVMPRGPDQPNGTVLISQQPRLAAALKEVSAIRRQFLAYFVDGVFLGDSVLSRPAPGFVKAYQLGGKLLILALNDSSEPRRLTIPSDLSLWLNSTRAYKVTCYGSTGKAAGITNGQGPQWLGVTPLLEPVEMAVFEIETI
jgi:hypothetical protein